MGFKLCSIDTNILLRLILRDNKEMFSRALDLITSNGMYFYVPDLAIAEVVYVMEGKNYSRAKIVDELETVMRAPRLDYYEELFAKVFRMYVERPKLSFNDCYLACAMEMKERTPLYTFDEELAKQHGAVCLVPTESPT